jgi:hypothetical protein
MLAADHPVPDAVVQKLPGMKTMAFRRPVADQLVTEENMHEVTRRIGWDVDNFCSSNLFRCRQVFVSTAMEDG